MSLETLGWAATIARRCGTDAATALLNEGLVSEEVFYRALARRLETSFLPGTLRLAEGVSHARCFAADAAPLACGAAPERVVAAPRGIAVAGLIAASERLARPPAITTPTALRQALFARHGAAIAEDASEALGRRRPEWSCRPGPQAIDLALVGIGLALVILLSRLPTMSGFLLFAFVQGLMLALLTFRLAAAAMGATEMMRPEVSPTQSVLLTDEALPTYTILVALYREAKVVPRLLGALRRLDYPAAKLDIKFLLEADDRETAAAFQAAPLPARFEIVTVPEGMPRTKPRALNAALPLARGEHLVVYDAEDVIAPEQLRLAATMFARAPASTACLQGRLVIDNHGDGWLPRLFAIEYAALFDVIGPALSAWRMPTPLGGTSTHFRTRVLRELHGWDAWNVTEDADLGLRMARAGYHVGDLPSSTFEEALADPRKWLRQRTRWMKGFLQTSFTHGRRPLDLYRRLGAAESLCVLALLPGTVVSALFYPFMLLGGLAELVYAVEDEDSLTVVKRAASTTVFLGGLAAMWLPGLVGCLRRGWFDLLPLVLLLPAYFLLGSLAAWLAVFELARHPHRWNKTEHGLARTSRTGALGRRQARPVRSASTVRPPSPLPVGSG
ncbi:glycosyltransferase [Methylorubrum populi]|uniref:glycosyltransferase family 2 protein n=1 Tax=Methylorubrum TaxID=2282523 RepID=UPI00115195DD|nr:glycosyltransferase [Methylorubrum populi]QDI81828.1 glycosyltransferase [Methylorubrum populi]